MVEQLQHRLAYMTELMGHFNPGLASSSELFWVVPNCANANVTSKVFGYAFGSRQTLLVLFKLSKEARNFAFKHWNGAIYVETSLQLRVRECPPDLSDKSDHDFHYPEELKFENPIVGF